MNEKDIFDRIMSLPGLRRFYGLYEKYKSVLLYLFFGGCTTLVSIGSFLLLELGLGLNALVANVGSWILAVGFAYVTNRVWVFDSKARGGEVVKEAMAFYTARLSTLGVEELLIFLFVTWLGCNGVLIKTLAQIVVLVGNYLLSKFLIFKSKQCF